MPFIILFHLDFPGGSVVKKKSACNSGNVSSIPLLERFPGEENGNPLQYSCLGNPMDRGTSRAIVHGVTKSQTQLSNQTTATEEVYVPFVDYFLSANIT